MDLNELNKKVEQGSNEIYGIFDTKVIGKIISKLATIITGVKYKYIVKTEHGFACINNLPINYSKEIATLANISEKVAPSWNLCFAVADEQIEDSEVHIRHDGYGGEGYCNLRQLGKYIQLARFNKNSNSFEFKTVNGKVTEDFICDFIIFVSNYRLERNIVNISESELNELIKKFIAAHIDYYTKYKEEQRKSAENMMRLNKEIDCIEKEGPSYIRMIKKLM